MYLLQKAQVKQGAQVRQGGRMKQSRCCGNCARGIKININKDILCKIHGIVSRDFICSKYRTLARTALEEKPKCVECLFFTLVEEETGKCPNNGFCQLFTVRCYDGDAKSACSKFCAKAERNIS
jgi:hypothetical protein